MSAPDPGLACHVRLTRPLALEARLAVAPGEILALVGRSGAGKSSLLKALAGLLPATGHIHVAGETWLDHGTSLPAHQRRTGFLFQAYALFPHLTAQENVQLAMPIPDEAQARSLLAAVQLQGLESRRPAMLSGGQQQRVALARALARSPRLLLLDEPFSATDRPTRRALADTIRHLRARLQMPTIIVSHDIDDVATLADTVAILENGRIAQHGPTAQVLASPLPEVADLVGR